MVEVFKTNVKDGRQALLLLERIHAAFAGYKANFDLDDCDRILRVRSISGSVEIYHLIALLKELGCHAEVLPDVVNSPRF